MNGLALITSVVIQLVVASTKNTARKLPSGKTDQANVAQAPMTSSVTMPALATFSLWRRSVKRQVSLVSV